MAVMLTISISTPILKTLTASKSLALAVVPGGSTGTPRAATNTAVKGAADFRAGSLPARLVSWAKGRKKPFGVEDLTRKFKIKRGHASMLLSYVVKYGAVERVGRGAYSAA
jgi:hypothetical protein